MAILVLGCLAISAGSTMINHNFIVEETAYGNLEPSSLTKQANRLLQSETATTEGRTVVSIIMKPSIKRIIMVHIVI